MKATGVAVGTAVWLLLALLWGSALAEGEYTFPYAKEVSAEGIRRIHIDNAVGEVRLKPSPEKDKITLRAEKEVCGDDLQEAEKHAQKIRIEVNKVGSVLRVHTDYPRYRRRGGLLKQLFNNWGSCQEVRYRIFVPEQTEIEVSTSSADIFGEKLHNDLKLQGSSSDIYLEEHRGGVEIEASSGDLELLDGEGDVRVEGSSSDVYLDHLKGEVHVSNTSGDVKVYHLGGDLVAESSSGDFVLKETRGNLRISTSSGDISVQGHRGGVKLHTSSGDLEVDLASTEGEDQYLRTTSGDVHLYLPDDVDGLVTVQTTSGEIHSRLAMETSSISKRSLQGRLGGGDSEIEICTVSGDVGLDRR